jgi:hypothetical protein
MRSLHLVTGLSAFSALIVVVGVGCSSSSSKAPAGATDGSVATDGAGEEDGGGDAESCTAADASLANLAPMPGTSEAGIAALDCEKTACGSEFTACAGDTCCNSTFIAAFLCLEQAADGGSTSSLAPSVLAACFSNVSSDTAGGNLLNCLIGSMSSCGLGDGGKPSTDGSAATDSAAAASDASDAAAAVNDGAIEQ